MLGGVDVLLGLRRLWEAWKVLRSWGKKGKIVPQDRHHHHWPLARWRISPSNVVLYIVLTNKRTFPKRVHCCCGLEI